MTDSFQSKTETFLSGATHIGAASPLPFALRQAALQLDVKVTIALFKEYVSLVKHIESLKPAQTEVSKPDPLLTPAGPALQTRAATN